MSVGRDSRIITLMYHRIEQPDTNPWGICVSPENFDEQIEVVKKYFPVITTDELIEQVSSGSIPETSVCITFDDGYADNYSNALPVLKKQDCPATFFIASAFIGSSLPYWWDELEMICLHAKHLPEWLGLSFNNTVHSFSFEPELMKELWQQHLVWQWHEVPPSKRCQSFISIWTLLRVLPYPEIKMRMDTIRSWAGATIHSRLPLNKHQLQSLSSEELVTIGLHTSTHPNLARHKKQVQAEEIMTGKQVLFNQFKIECSILAYPYGSFNETTLSVAKDTGMRGCFTTEPKAITVASDLMKLSRYQVFDLNRKEFEKRLLKWIAE